ARGAARPGHGEIAGRSGVGAGDRQTAGPGRRAAARPTGPAARGRPRAAFRLLPPGGPDKVRPGKLRTARGGRTRRRHAAARLHRPGRRRRHRRAAGGRLQDRQSAARGPGAGRIQGDVPDEVLCRGALPVARCAARPAAAYLPGRRSGARLLAGPRRAGALREDPDGDLACDPIRRCDRRFPSQPVAAVRLVCTSRALPGVRRHTAALPRLAGPSRRRRRGRGTECGTSSARGWRRTGRMIGWFYHRLPGDEEYQAFESTEYTRSNWGPDLQHGSPPLALLTKLIEDLSAGSGLRIGRLSLDILGAIPVAPVRARAWVKRPGTRVAMVAAEMLADRADGSARTLARVTVCFKATSTT